MFIKAKLIGTRQNRDFDEERDPLLRKLTGEQEHITEVIDAIIYIEKPENILTILPGVENRNSTSVELLDDTGETVNYLFSYPFEETVEKFKKIFPEFNIVEF